MAIDPIKKCRFCGLVDGDPRMLDGRPILKRAGSPDSGTPILVDVCPVLDICTDCLSGIDDEALWTVHGYMLDELKNRFAMYKEGFDPKKADRVMARMLKKEAKQLKQETDDDYVPGPQDETNKD
jgi:hypothetical protein